MRRKRKYLFIAIFGCSCFTLLLLFNFGFFGVSTSSDNSFISGSDSETDSSQSGIDDIRLIIDYGGIRDTKRFEDFSLKKGKTTVFDAVNKQCDVEYEIYPGDQYYITHIDGVGRGWVYTVNDDMPNDAVNHYNLKDGDKVKFEYVGTS